MKRKVFIAIATVMFSATASFSAAQSKNSLPASPASKPLPALSEEQIKSLIQSETEKKDALRGQAEAERKFDTTMVWVQVLLGGVSLLLAFVTVVPISLGVFFWIFRKGIFGQLNAEATEEVKKQVENHLKPIIDTEVQVQISALIGKKLNQRVQEFEAAVPASTKEIPSPEKLSQIDELRRRIKDLQDLIPTVMPSAEYYFKQGNAFYFEKQYKDAIASYDKAIEFQPDDHEAWSNRGVALGNLWRFDEAISSFDKALEFKPDYSEAWYNRGLALSSLNRYEDAISSYDKALEFKPEDSQAWYNRGVTLGNLNRYEDAINSYEKAIEFNPDNSEAWSNQGAALGNLNRHEDAISSYDKALEFKPDNSQAWTNRGVALCNLNRYEEAINSHDKALEFNPDFFKVWTNRGVALSNLNRYEEAITSHDKAIKLKPNDSSVWYNRACSYALQGKVEAAVLDLEKAIELDLTCREKAKTDSDFDKIRHDERFQTLLNSDH